MRKRQAGQKEAPSKVLLICVYDTVVVQVTNETVLARFSGFGAIIKVLIFQRGEVTKFFLEYLHLQSAIQAKNCLDGAKLYESICKMNIYYSNFRSVDLKHETTEGLNLDPVVFTPSYYFYYPMGTYVPMAIQNNLNMDDYVDMSIAQQYGFQNQREGANQKGYYMQGSGYMQKQSYSDQVSSQSPDDQNIQVSIESNIDWLLRSEQKKNNLQRKQSEQKSCFLWFQLKQQIPNRSVYNLFSNFGNISYIKKTKRSIYIKFRSIQFAAMAKNYLQGYTLLSNKFILQYVNDISEALPKEDQYSQITYFDMSFDRFTSNRSITVNPPANTIHVSSLRRESCRTDNLRYIFQEFGPVQAVEIIVWPLSNSNTSKTPSTQSPKCTTSKSWEGRFKYPSQNLKSIDLISLFSQQLYRQFQYTNLCQIYQYESLYSNSLFKDYSHEGQFFYGGMARTEKFEISTDYSTSSEKRFDCYRQEKYEIDFQMPDQSPRRGRGHFFEPTSFQRPFKPSLHQVPPIKHWHLRQSKIRTLDFQPTQNPLRREMKHFRDNGSNPQSSRLQSLRTFYHSNRPSQREHSVQMQMQRKGRIDQAEMRRTFFKDVDVFGRR